MHSPSSDLLKERDELRKGSGRRRALEGEPWPGRGGGRCASPRVPERAPSLLRQGWCQTLRPWRRRCAASCSPPAWPLPPPRRPAMGGQGRRGTVCCDDRRHFSLAALHLFSSDSESPKANTTFLSSSHTETRRYFITCREGGFWEGSSRKTRLDVTAWAERPPCPTWRVSTPPGPARVTGSDIGRKTRPRDARAGLARGPPSSLLCPFPPPRAIAVLPSSLSSSCPTPSTLTHTPDSPPRQPPTRALAATHAAARRGSFHVHLCPDVLALSFAGVSPVGGCRPQSSQTHEAHL